MLRKTNRGQWQDGANWRGYDVFARRDCRCLIVSSRLPTPGNLCDLSVFDLIIDLFDLRVLLAPFGIGGHNLFKVSEPGRCFSVGQFCFQRRAGIGQLPSTRSSQLAGGVVGVIEEARESSGIVQLFAQPVRQFRDVLLVFCEIYAPLVKQTVHLHDPLAQLLDFVGVVRGEFLHLRFVVGFGFGQMSADFLDLRYVVLFGVG